MVAKSLNAESIFFAALEKSTHEERAAYLEKACGPDAKLRQRVEKLLNAQAKVGDFLEEPLGCPVATPDTKLQEGPGTIRFSRMMEAAPETAEQVLEIRQAVEAIFSVKVESVRTMNMIGKLKRTGRHWGRRPNWKKAIVKLQEGHAIEDFY